MAVPADADGTAIGLSLRDPRRQRLLSDRDGHHAQAHGRQPRSLPGSRSWSSSGSGGAAAWRRAPGTD